MTPNYGPNSIAKAETKRLKDAGYDALKRELAAAAKKVEKSGDSAAQARLDQLTNKSEAPRFKSPKQAGGEDLRKRNVDALRAEVREFAAHVGE